ncbi:DUF2207 domain-containing protein [Microbacterium thalassium]|uniref:Amino acid transporter n=1 Tax=Microbacterium thalassium TaxID=362649 RepID=A0A7X0KWE1_9MICO|nr:DUF2207 domain-containing protein [Microbacterium thalassium]MBB6393034.1 amino acid transporter [Microbacterium thalassium]GLK22735.1 hypothetical protein GCM10017607_00530 [Microbacterium thalassium]
MPGPARILIVIAVAAGSIFAGTAPAVAAPAPESVPNAIVTAGVDDFTFASMDVEYTLGRAEDGASTLTVVETFVAQFPDFDQNRGMRRSIPDSYLGIPLFPHLVSITDGEGNPRASEVDSSDGYYSMTSRADDYVLGTQTYVFTYTLQNVTRFFSDTGVDEFYWDVNGEEWRQPFGRVSVALVVPPDLAAALTGDRACYAGYTGSTDTCDITADAAEDGSTTIRASVSDVGPYQTLTIAVAFEAGTFTPFDTSYFASVWGWLQAIAAAGVVAVLAMTIWVRRRFLRDEPGRPTIIAEYTPPAVIDALESAVMLGKTSKAIPAEVLEQAVVGSIRIIEGPPRWFGSARLSAELIDPSRADGDGRMLLSALFPYGRPGEVFEFGKSDKRLSSAAQRILAAATKELKRRGLRRRVPAGARAWPILGMIATGALVAFFGFIGMENGMSGLVPFAVIVGAAISVLVVITLVSRQPLTAKGAETRDHLAGLKVFIEWAEADRIRMLQSPKGAERVPVDVDDPRQMLKIYEALLPYAVVFGQEKQWSEQLAVLYGPNNGPSWYAGRSAFNAYAFSRGISSLSASTSSSASTSGGSGGGGSAGGGGGGGGGGGV